MNRTAEEMKRVYTEARSEDVIPSFDREALWTRISERMEQPAPVRRIYLRRVSYAAAVAAGMLIMLLCLPASKHTESLSATRDIRRQSPYPVPEQIQTAPVTAMAVPLHRKTNRMQNIVPAVPEPAPVKQEAPLLAVAPVQEQNTNLKRINRIHHPVAMEVKHLMDIGNEDRHIIDAGPLPELQKATFIHLNRPGGNNEGQQQLAFRNVF